MAQPKQREDRSTSRRRPPLGAQPRRRNCRFCRDKVEEIDYKNIADPPAVHLGEGQDPLAPDHRRLPPAPGAGRRCREARARDGAPPLRLRQLGVQVILLQDVEKVGLRGEVVDVARGYARNFLVAAAAGGDGHAREGRRAREARRPASPGRRRRPSSRRASCARSWRGTELRFDVKAGPTGSLFGSVTATELADEIWQQSPRSASTAARSTSASRSGRSAGTPSRSSSSRT